MSLWHHGLCYDVIGFPNIRRRAWPAGASYLTWELRVHSTLVLSSTAGYSCMLGSTCWRVPASGAYFLLLYLIGLLLLWASPQALTPRNTPTHPVSVISGTSRAVCTGPTSFWLVPVSTVTAVQVYIFGSVSPPGLHILLPCGVHHNFGVPGWAPINREWPDLWKVFHLGWNPSLQVCGRTRRGEIRTFVSGELAGWIEETRTWQHVVKRKSHSPNCARILGVLYIIEPLRST